MKYIPSISIKRNSELRKVAENKIAKLKGEPITKTIAANKIWNSYLASKEKE